MPDVEQGVLLIIAKVAKKEPSELKMETRLAEELMLKSMSKIEIAALIDDRFGTSLTNFEIRVPKTVKEVISLVESKL